MRVLKDWIVQVFRFLFFPESSSEQATLSRPTDLPEALSEATDKGKTAKTVTYGGFPEITVADYDKRLTLHAKMLGRRNSKRFVIGDDESPVTTPDSPMCEMFPKVDSDNNLHIPREWYTRARRLKVGEHLT